MKDSQCVALLQWALPRLGFRWSGFRKVRRQVCKRIDRRIDQLKLDGPDDYREFLEQNPAEWALLDQFCRISISRFYRDQGVFDELRQTVFPRLADRALRDGQSVLRCWSAGCASGEEPYTVNLVWQSGLQDRYPELCLSITATDSDQHMLSRARDAIYPPSSLKDLPPDWVSRAFHVADRGGESFFCLRPEFRAGIEWICQDLRTEIPAGNYHLILCRHLVFTYFDAGQQRRILDQLIDGLLPGGFLVTGKQEKIEVDMTPLESLVPQIGIWQKR